MYLATTSDRRLWSKEDKIIYLGNWCLVNESLSDGKKLEIEISSNPWDEKRDLQKIRIYLNGFAERVLSFLSEKLNEKFDLTLTNRQWRIITGTWIYHAIHLIYDRYLFLTNAKEKYSDIWTYIVPASRSFVPKTTNQFRYTQYSDISSIILISRIVEALGITAKTTNIKIENKMAINSNAKILIASFINKLKLLFPINKRYFYKSGTILFSQILFNTNVFNQFESIKYNINQLTVPHWRPLFCNEVNLLEREKLFSTLSFNDFFEKVCIYCFSYILPTCFFEDFHLWQKKADSLPIKNIKALLTAYGFSNGNDLFTFWSQKLIEHDCKLIGVQHGGGYGIFGYCPEEEHETNCSDIFVTWGWKHAPKHKQLPPLKFANKKNNNSTERNSFTFVSTERPAFTHRIQSHPLTGQRVSYFEWQKKFFSLLSRKVVKRIIYRPYNNIYSPTTEKWWENTKEKFIVFKGNYNHLFSVTSLFIFDHNSTGFLETLTLNIPTIIYWNPDLFELRDSAIPDFDNLKKINIFHQTPESAANFLNSIVDDPFSWWNQIKTQKVRGEFCQKYAWTSDKWNSYWNQFLNTL